MKRPFGSGRYANVTATLALVVALSGTSYAAAKLAPNSVGTAQLKNNAVTTAKVKDGTLLATDFKAGVIKPGKDGAQGAAGPAGQGRRARCHRARRRQGRQGARRQGRSVPVERPAVPRPERCGRVLGRHDGSAGLPRLDGEHHRAVPEPAGRQVHRRRQGQRARRGPGHDRRAARSSRVRRRSTAWAGRWGSTPRPRSTPPCRCTGC